MYTEFTALFSSKKLKEKRLIDAMAPLLSYKMYNKRINGKTKRKLRRDAHYGDVAVSVRKFLEENRNRTSCYCC